MSVHGVWRTCGRVLGHVQRAPPNITMPHIDPLSVNQVLRVGA